MLYMLPLCTQRVRLISEFATTTYLPLKHTLYGALNFLGVLVQKQQRGLLVAVRGLQRQVRQQRAHLHESSDTKHVLQERIGIKSNYVKILGE